MIQSKRDYKYYLERDRMSSNIPLGNNVSARIKRLLFPIGEWKFIKALRYLEYCENVRKNQMGGYLLMFGLNTDTARFL